MRIEPRDYDFLLRAIGLAEAFVGQTSPNPPVGAVCVRDGVLLGEGAHQGAGLPHAEVNALAPVADARGATLYVTLEPCSTTGRTPPCCDLILARGIARVVVGCLDPNPKHAGRGIELLRAQGVEVLIAEGEIAERCKQLVAPFVKAVTTGVPYVRLKLALTLDGFVADRTGTSRWITGAEARAYVQGLRSRVDAVMVGAGTVRADHPSLQPHLPEAPQKWRVLIDRHEPIAAADIDARTLVATRDLGYDGKDLRVMLQALCRRGVNDVLCEGGGVLAGALLEAGLVDELLLIYAPKVLGDAAARRGLVTAPRVLAEAMTFAVEERLALGEDTLLKLRRREEYADGQRT